MYFDLQSVIKYKVEIINELAAILKWDENKKRIDALHLDAEISNAKNFLQKV